MAIKAFGFSFDNDSSNNNLKTFAEPQSDGQLNVAALDAFGSPVAYSLDMDNVASNENRIIESYREIAMIPELDKAIEEICAEAIAVGQGDKIVGLNLDNLMVSEPIKAKIKDSFDHVLSLLHFRSKGYNIFRRWYIDGRIPYHIMIDVKSPKKGIKELRYIDPKKIKKVRKSVKTDKTETLSGRESVGMAQKEYTEFYVYNDKGVESSGATGSDYSQTGNLPIAKDSIAFAHSGLLDPAQKMILSFIHKALRPANNLRMMEDALVIYRITRAPERRIFYVDVGNLPRGRSEQYMTQIMNKYKNKLVYDATTGKVKDDRRHMAMTEDYWIPRREGSRGTEIDTLAGAENLGQIDDVEYFKAKLSEASNVPMGRLSSEPSMFSRGTEVTRDEVRFSRFVARLRMQFSTLFDDLLGKQLVLTGVMSWEFWEAIKESVVYDFYEDNHFRETIETEILQTRVTMATDMDPFVGKYYSREYIMKNALKMTDDEIAEEDGRIKKEISDGTILDPKLSDDGGNPFDDSPAPAPEPEPEAEPIAKVETKMESESEEDLTKAMAALFESMTAKPNGNK
jgi:hypothetical protein